MLEEYKLATMLGFKPSFDYYVDIDYMKENKMYKQLVIYWSSDYSGSMFAHLPVDTKVLAMASAAADEK